MREETIWLALRGAPHAAETSGSLHLQPGLPPALCFINLGHGEHICLPLLLQFDARVKMI